MSLIIDYPWYFILLCIALGVVYALVLYWIGTRRRTDPPFSSRLTWLLTALRTLSVAAIAFLLLAPLVRHVTNRKEKPVVIVAEDNSKSLDYSPDSAYYHTEFQQAVNRLADKLSADFEVVRYRYGSDVLAADEKQDSLFTASTTDMGAMMSLVIERYFHRNVGAVIVTGDGIFNRGANPLNAVSEATFPVYTVAMGDTTVRRDAAIANVRCNRIAYMGNNFPMEVTVNASQMKGERSTLSVACDGRKVFSKEISFDDSRFSTTESLMLDAAEAGVHNYEIVIAPLRDEQTTRNNRRVVAVEVIDGHQKVAILYAAPHPDVGALRRSVEQNQNYEVETFLAKDFKGNVKDYDLLILHQLPCKLSEANIDIATLLKEGTPALFVVGSQTDLARLNALHTGMEVFSRIDRVNEVSAAFNNDFTYFTLSDDARRQLEKFPPLVSPFGDYKLSGTAQKLFVSKIGGVNSGMPLVAVAQQGERRYSFIAGEGLWRWRLADWQENQSYAHFDEFLDKLVVFTALRVNKERFHVEAKPVYGESEAVEIGAQLYNDNYEMVNTPEVSIEIKRIAGDDGAPDKGSRYVFNRVPTGYALNLGILGHGSYRYTASTHFNGKDYRVSGSFLVEQSNLEALRLVADHSLLATLAEATGGAMVPAREVDRLEQLLKQRDDMKTVIYSETRYSDMLNIPWLFVLLVVLLGTEWIVRKYNGEV